MGFNTNNSNCDADPQTICQELNECEIQALGNVDTGALADGDILCWNASAGVFTNVSKQDIIESMEIYVNDGSYSVYQITLNDTDGNDILIDMSGLPLDLCADVDFIACLQAALVDANTTNSTLVLNGTDVVLTDSDGNALTLDLAALQTDCCQENADAIAALVDANTTNSTLTLSGSVLNLTDSDGGVVSVDLALLITACCAANTAAIAALIDANTVNVALNLTGNVLEIQDSDGNSLTADLSTVVTDCCVENTAAIAALVDSNTVNVDLTLTGNILEIEDSDSNELTVDLSTVVTDCCVENTAAIAALIDQFVDGGDLNNYTLNFTDSTGANPSFTIDLSDLPNTLCADSDFVTCLASNSAFIGFVTNISLSGSNIIYIDENASPTTLDLCPVVKLCETLTSLVYDPATYQITFSDENGDTTVVNLAALAADIFVTGATYNASTGVLTLTDNDAGTPDVTVNLAALISQVVNNNDGSYTHTSGDGSVTVINVLGDTAGNLLNFSPNGGVSVLAIDVVTGICNDTVTKDALIACLGSDVGADSSIIEGTQTVNPDGSVTQCFTTVWVSHPTIAAGTPVTAVDDVCFTIPKPDIIAPALEIGAANPQDTAALPVGKCYRELLCGGKLVAIQNTSGIFEVIQSRSIPLNGVPSPLVINDHLVLAAQTLQFAGEATRTLPSDPHRDLCYEVQYTFRFRGETANLPDCGIHLRFFAQVDLGSGNFVAIFPQMGMANEGCREVPFADAIQTIADTFVTFITVPAGSAPVVVRARAASNLTAPRRGVMTLWDTNPENIAQGQSKILADPRSFITAKATTTTL